MERETLQASERAYHSPHGQENSEANSEQKITAFDFLEFSLQKKETQAISKRKTAIALAYFIVISLSIFMVYSYDNQTKNVTIVGSVVDENGNPMANVLISAGNDSEGVLTDYKGSFKLNKEFRKKDMESGQKTLDLYTGDTPTHKRKEKTINIPVDNSRVFETTFSLEPKD